MVTAALLALTTLSFTPLTAYADEFTCNVLDTGCTANAPSLAAPTEDSYNLLVGLMLSWSDDQHLNYRVCVARDQDMAGQTCKTTDQLSLLATDLIHGDDSDGLWYWQVTALAGGLLSHDGKSTVGNFIVDTPPTVSLLVNDTSSPADVGNDATVVIQGTASDTPVESCDISVSNSDGGVATFDCGTASWSTAGLPSGSYTVGLNATDATMTANGVAPVHASVTIGVDNDGPVITLGNEDALFDEGSTTPELSTEESHGPVTYEWTASDTNPAVLDYETTVANPEFGPTVNGQYQFTVVATDVFGNQSSQVFHFTYLSEIPIVPVPEDPGTVPVADIPPVDTTIITGGTATSVTTTTSRKGDDDEGTAPAASLGASTIAKTVTADPKDPAPIVATHQGWQILGILWYWWGVIIVVLVAGTVTLYKMLKKRPDLHRSA